MSEYSVELKGLNKVYSNLLKEDTVALKDINLQIRPGEFISIIGPSGCGKSTLLRIIGNLDKPTSGTIEYRDGADQQMGFVFQDFNLLDTFSIKDNIFLPLVLAKTPVAEMKKRLTPLAEMLGISGILEKYPYEVSGGQKQRAAVARALITKPDLILADEPTGALDSRSTDSLLAVFEEINRKGQTILMVTHSIKAASHAGRVLFIKDGTVFHQIYRGELQREAMYQKISDTLTLLTTGGNGHE